MTPQTQPSPGAARDLPDAAATDQNAPGEQVLATGPTADLLRRVNQRLATFGVLIMLGIGILTTLDVVILRGLLNAPISGSNEVLQTVFATAIAFVLAGGLSANATIEIDLLSGAMPRRGVAALRAIGAALYCAVLIVLVIAVLYKTRTAFERQTQTVLLQWQLWPFYTAISAAALLCVPAQYLNAVTLARLWRRGGALSAHALTLGVMLLAAGLTWWLDQHAGALLGNMVGVSSAVFGLLWVLILLYVPVAAAMMVCALLGVTALFGFNSGFNVLGSEMISLLTNTELAIIPFFLMMGGFAVVGGLASDIYRLAHALCQPFRGGLAMATIGGCAGFGALTGSSLATVATMGSAAYPEMARRDYAPSLSAGSIVVGGTLGQLIPPSTAIVVYALLVEESIGTLYIAALVPAAITIVFYLVAIRTALRLKPGLAPRGQRWDMVELRRALAGSAFAALLFATVIGGIFFGIFTATEAAAVGAVEAFLIALLRGSFRGGRFWRVASETTHSTSMIYLMIVGAFMLTFFLASTGLPQVLTAALAGSGLPPIVIILSMTFIFILLGCMMDSMTIMMITAATAGSVVTSLGYDLVWWGIIMLAVVEIGVITPPFGMNLFIMKSVAPDVPLRTVYRGVLPFVGMDILKVVLLILFPVLSLWLPTFL